MFDAVDRKPKSAADPPLVLWNQRWEYDKDPETFLRALQAVAAEGVEFRVALAGVNHRETAPEFDEARSRLGDRVTHYGTASPGEYVELLRRADVVVSTAIHEFFGVAVVEAIYGGCFPVLPNRLAYPEMIAPGYREMCLFDSFGELVERLVWALTHAEERARIARELRPYVARFDWSQVAGEYDGRLSEFVRELG